MLEMLMQWYRRRFSDPEAIALLVILVAGFGIIFFFSGLLAPLLVAIVLAYLLEWPTVRLQSIGCSRPWATSIVLILFVGILLLMAFVVLPIAWQQGIYLIRDMPGMLNKLSDFAATLPRRYPALMDAGIIDLCRLYERITCHTLIEATEYGNAGHTALCGSLKRHL